MPPRSAATWSTSVDLVIDAGACDGQVTTVIDLSGEAPRLLREGKGDIAPVRFVKAALH